MMANRTVFKHLRIFSIEVKETRLSGLNIGHFFRAHFCDYLSKFGSISKLLGAQVELLGAKLDIKGIQPPVPPSDREKINHPQKQAKTV